MFVNASKTVMSVISYDGNIKRLPEHCNIKLREKLNEKVTGQKQHSPAIFAIYQNYRRSKQKTVLITS